MAVAPPNDVTTVRLHWRPPAGKTYVSFHRFYGDALIDSLGDGVRGFQRWGFAQGEAPLIGALRNPEPITRPLALAIVGAIDAPTAARRAQVEVEAVKAGLR
jgi:hypothetical protein